MCTLDYINFYQFCNEIVFFKKKWANSGLFFVYFPSSQTQYYRKTVDFVGFELGLSK